MSTKPSLPGDCGCRPTPPGAEHASAAARTAWNIRYMIVVAVLATVWWLVYVRLEAASRWLVRNAFGFAPDSPFGASFEFFMYDTIKILMLVAALIYMLAWVRASLNVERVRDFLAGKRRDVGYVLGSVCGAVTPFCSCSSIPLFLGFTSAGIPIGISMAFLITSPLVNEIAVVLLWGLLGWKFTVAYVLAGLGAGIIGGFVMDALRAERWLQPFILEALQHTAVQPGEATGGEMARLTIRQRHEFAAAETVTIYTRIWKWVVIGVGLGAALHGYVPANWFAEHFSAGEWWTVPAAVFVAIPLYSNVTGIIPVMETLLLKGLPIGTTMAFCMSAVVASIPELMMLRQIMTFRLLAAFVIYIWLILNVVGWLFNIIGPYIL